MINDLDFSPGKITHNDLKLDENVPLKNQVDVLKEDLLQVNYNDKYIIDVGWYPEFDENGNFKIYVIEDFNWSYPKIIKKSKTLDGLILDLVKCINYVRGKFKLN